MIGKGKAIEDFDDILRDNNQGLPDNNRDRLRSSFQSGANQRGGLGDVPRSNIGFGGAAPIDPDDFFSRPIDTGIGTRNEDFGFGSNHYTNNDYLSAPELPDIDQENL